MTSAELLDLAARCEQAKGADVNIDRDIATAKGLGRWFASGNRLWRPTLSLDVALDLIPSSLRVVTISEIASGEWAAKLGYRDKPGGFPCSPGASPALAVTAAALRALADQERQS